MTQKFRLLIAAVVEFPVNLKIRDAGITRDFRFHLIGKRLTAEEAQEQLAGKPEAAADEAVDLDAATADKGLTVREFLRTNIVGWRGQKLVTADDEGTPADFSLEAFDAMLTIVGAAAVFFEHYVATIPAQSDAPPAKQSAEGARRKN